jgi:hypothetical protein
MLTPEIKERKRIKENCIIHYIYYTGIQRKSTSPDLPPPTSLKRFLKDGFLNVEGLQNTVH